MTGQFFSRENGNLLHPAGSTIVKRFLDSPRRVVYCAFIKISLLLFIVITYDIFDLIGLIFSGNIDCIRRIDDDHIRKSVGYHQLMGCLVKHGDIFTLILDNLTGVLAVIVVCQRLQCHNAPPVKFSCEQLHLF